jgi:hypothetical protein
LALAMPVISVGRPWAPSCVALAPSKPDYWYAAFTVRVSSSVSSSVGLSDSLSPGFVVGAARFGSVIDVTPGTVISQLSAARPPLEGVSF